MMQATYRSTLEAGGNMPGVDPNHFPTADLAKELGYPFELTRTRRISIKDALESEGVKTIRLRIGDRIYTFIERDSFRRHLDNIRADRIPAPWWYKRLVNSAAKGGIPWR